MSLRDRIAKTLHGISCSHLDIEVDWASEYEGVRARFYEDADAILSDFEIAALREVAEAAVEYRRAERRADCIWTESDGKVRAQMMRRLESARTALDASLNRLNAALARLEEARRG